MPHCTFSCSPTRRVRSFFVCLCLCLFLLSSWAPSPVVVRAWNCEGHMLIAEIAYRHLQPRQQRKVDNLIRRFAAEGPFPHSPDFTQVACWPDDLRGWHLETMKSWHYIDLPYLAPGFRPNATAVAEINAVRVITDMIRTLRTRGSPRYVYTFALVYLIHVVGDLHQPLHAAARYSPAHPHGDAGGNGVWLLLNDTRVRLHGFWDDSCVLHPRPLTRPLSASDQARLRARARAWESIQPLDPALVAVTDPDVIAAESFAFAVNASYRDLGLDEPGADTPEEKPGVGATGRLEGKEGVAVSPAYVQRCRDVTQARLVLAGRRLAYLLDPLLAQLDDVAAGKPERIRNPSWGWRWRRWESLTGRVPDWAVFRSIRRLLGALEKGVGSWLWVMA